MFQRLRWFACRTGRRLKVYTWNQGAVVVQSSQDRRNSWNQFRTLPLETVLELEMSDWNLLPLKWIFHRCHSPRLDTATTDMAAFDRFIPPRRLRPGTPSQRIFKHMSFYELIHSQPSAVLTPVPRTSPPVGEIDFSTAPRHSPRPAPSQR